MSIESVLPSSHLILCRTLLLPLANPVLLLHTFPLPKFSLSTLSLELTVCKDEPYSLEAEATECKGEMENKSFML